MAVGVCSDLDGHGHGCGYNADLLQKEKVAVRKQ